LRTLIQNDRDIILKVTATVQYRLDKAKSAANCETILWENGVKEVVEQIRALTQGRGADVCVEAVGFEPDRNILDRAKAVVNLEKGSPKVLEACMSAVRRGGTVSVLGVYPTTYDNFPVGQFFDKGIILKGGQAPAQKHIDKLLKYVQEGKVKLDDIITHRLPLSQIAHAYDIFKNKEDKGMDEENRQVCLQKINWRGKYNHTPSGQSEYLKN
jgi:threonine dehydrogenase-like Zn-dependent dehydrogenase